MHTMHLLPGVAIQPNLEMKTRPKELLGSLLLVITLPLNLCHKRQQHKLYNFADATKTHSSISCTTFVHTTKTHCSISYTTFIDTAKRTAA